MSDDEYSDQQSEGGGLRRQLEEALRQKTELEQSLSAKVQEAEQRGRQQAQRRFEALKTFGEDRPGLADAWVDKNPEGDLTPDAATEFAAAFGVTLGSPPPPEPAPEPISDEVKDAAGSFHEAVTTVQAAGKTYSPEEIRQIGLKDEAEALRLIAQGAMKTE